MATYDFLKPQNFNSSWFNPSQVGQGFGDISQFGQQPSLSDLGSGMFQQKQFGGNVNTIDSGLFSGTGLGFNLPTLNFGLGALGSLSSLYNGFQANRLARDQFNLTKDITNTNLNNSIKSYNTALEGRTRARTAQEGGSAAEAQAYIDRNRLTR